MLIFKTRRWSAHIPSLLAAAASLTQISAVQHGMFVREALDAASDYAYADPLTDPTPTFDLLAVDPLVRAGRAEGQAIKLRNADARTIQAVQVEHLSPLVSSRVSRALLILDGETRKVQASRRSAYAFSTSRIVRPSAPGRRRAHPSPVVASAIEHAARKTGISSGYLLRAAKRESSFDPLARARTSSALGLYQFLDDTWLSTLHRHGARHGYGAYASQISVGRDGAPRVNDLNARFEILSARKDPVLSALMGAEFTRDNRDRLIGFFGRAPNDGELYVAHFMGADGAIRLYAASHQRPNAIAADLFPRAAAANKSVFFDGFGRARNVYAVTMILERKGSV